MQMFMLYININRLPLAYGIICNCNKKYSLLSLQLFVKIFDQNKQQKTNALSLCVMLELDDLF